jgi:hypothetical protein
MTGAEQETTMTFTKDRPWQFKCTPRSIRARLKSGWIIECSGRGWWQRIDAVRYNDGKNWQGLWVRESGGLGGWFRPDAARCYKA